jgi:putative MATE family efflux protein
VLVPVGVTLAGPLVTWFGATGDAAGYAGTYLRISMFGVPAMLVGYAGTGYLRGRQDTRTPLLVAIGSSVLNLVAELVAIYGLGFGIGASAATTVAVQWGAGAVYAVRIGRRAVALGVGVRPEPRAVGRLARVGVALLVRTIALRLALTGATAVATRLGTTEVGAHQIAFELWNALALALDALAIAAQAMVGRLLGAGDADAARAASRRLLELGLGFGVLTGLGLLALRGLLPAVFTADPQVRALAGFLLLYVALDQPLNGVVFVLDGVLMGAGDMRYLAVSMVAGVLLFGAVAVALAGTGAGIGWLWAALTGLMLVRMITLAARLRGERWAVVGAVR